MAEETQPTLGTAVAPMSEAAFRMSPAMAIWFNDALFERAKIIAGYLADAKGFVPDHLAGNNKACFAVVERSLTWRLSPYAVAQSTYATPGGRVGFEGKLCQAILENSGKIEGGVDFEHYVKVKVKWPDGRERTFHSNDPALEDAINPTQPNAPKATEVSRADWDKVQGKFEIKTSGKSGKDYVAPTWTQDDAKGLGVTVSAQVRGESRRRRINFDLIQAWPRNSTLWATDPMTQICYTAVRRFASSVVPGIFMGTPFDHDDTGGVVIDVTPSRPTREQFDDKPARETEASKTADTTEMERKEPDPPSFEWVGSDGSVLPCNEEDFIALALTAIELPDEKIVEGLLETNSPQFAKLSEANRTKVRDAADAAMQAFAKAHSVTQKAAEPPPAQLMTVTLKDGRLIELAKPLGLSSSPKRGASKEWTEDRRIDEWCAAMMLIAEKAASEHVAGWLSANRNTIDAIAKIDGRSRQAANVLGAFDRRLQADFDAAKKGDDMPPIPANMARQPNDKATLFDGEGKK